MKEYNNKMVLESLGLPMFQDISTLAEVTRLTEKLLYFYLKKTQKVDMFLLKLKRKMEIYEK